MNSKTEKLLESREELYNEIARVAMLVYEFRNSGKYYRFDSDDNITIERFSVSIEWETSSCGCCSPDYYELEFPISYLFNDEWENDLRLEMNKERKEKEERELKATQEATALKDERDLKQYLKLKTKFEEGI